MSRLRAVVACLAAMTLAACATPRTPAGDHDAAIWDVERERFVSPDELADALVRSHYRLLGERHDNPEHHALRAGLVAAIVARGARPAVVFEQFDIDHDAALLEAQKRPADAERIADAGRLDRKSWEWPLHKPVLEAALAVPLPVRAGNLSRSALRGDLRAVVDTGTTPWTQRLRAAPWSDAQERKLAVDIVDGHCGKLPAKAVPRIALAQRARDAAMAQALVDAATADGAILIAGNGHVRRDVGVPAYLDAARWLHARDTVVAVGFVEVPEGGRGRSLARALAALHPGFDYLWLTRAVARDDPCAQIAGIPGMKA